MNRFFAIVGALALGAGTMYYLDPQQGRRRRALVGDRIDSVSHDARHYLASQRKRATDRVRGLFAQVRSRMLAGPPTDQQLHGHLRSRLGRVVSYPHAIETEVMQGRVTLRGDILQREYNPLMTEIWALPGVAAVDSQLAQHAEPGNIPGMQGRARRIGSTRLHGYARNAATALAVAGGLTAGLRALRAEGPVSTGMFSLAFALFAFGMGDGAQRLVRQRRWRRMQPGTRQAAEAAQRERPSEKAVEEETPALLTPPESWH